MNEKTNVDGERADAVRRALAALQINELQVEVTGDRVYLRGTATCYNKKREAGELARQAAPGSGIENELRVGRAFDDEKDVEREVQRALAALPGDVLERMTVAVRAGVVHLAGTAQTLAERQAIECAAWNSCSISGVDNQISLATRGIPDADVATALNQYVERTLNIRTGAVVVEYRTGTAYISGQVESLSQSQAIEDLVRWHDQVNDVVNRLSTPPARVPRMAASAAFRRE